MLGGFWMKAASKTGKRATDRAVSRRFSQALKGEGKDERPEVRQLLKNIKAALPQLTKLFHESGDHWAYEDHVYRFYHRSFKVFHRQDATLKIVEALKSLAPRNATSTGLNPFFLDIVKDGTGRTFKISDNSRWPKATRPILEAFFHARYFLEMIVKYGKELKVPPAMLPSGWAAVLYLYNLR
jgi:hypothetical protein